jgi:hypothetical protein
MQADMFNTTDSIQAEMDAVKGRTSRTPGAAQTAAPAGPPKAALKPNDPLGIR